MGRLRAAVGAGVDVGILEGITGKAQARRAVREGAPWLLVLGMVVHGATPTIKVEEAREMGGSGLWFFGLRRWRRGMG